MKDIYADLGVSSSKTGVQKAVKAARIKSIVPDSFAIVTDDIAGNSKYGNAFHTDGHGSGSLSQYMCAKEKGYPFYMRKIAPFVGAMNFDDIVCTAPVKKGILIDTIARNPYRVDDDLLSHVIEGFSIYLGWLKESCGVDAGFGGGEVADLPDQTDTLIVDASLATRFELDKALSGNNIKPGDLIISIASTGKQANYELDYPNELGSNGHTLARRSIFNPIYNEKYPETVFGNLSNKLCRDSDLIVEKLIKKGKGYFGEFLIDDVVPGTNQTAGDILTRPPRTYLPIANALHDAFGGNDLHFMAQNSGGGQTKLNNFGENLIYIKDDLFKMPVVFEVIQNASGQPWRYMYSSFNCGSRFDVVVDPNIENDTIKLISGFCVDAKVTGRIEKNDSTNPKNKKGNSLVINGEYGTFVYPEI